jgi:hypothetical protein
MEHELHIFRGVVYFSLALTMVNIIISLLVLTKRFVRNPKYGYKYYFGIAGIKLLLGITLLTVLWPSCPYGCGENNGGGSSFCQVDNFFTLYPIIVLAIGLNWMFRGYQYYKMYQVHQAARQASASSIGENGEREGDEASSVAMILDPCGKLLEASTTNNEGIV